MVEEKSIELFITEEEFQLLEALAQADVPHSLRAQAILAVDAGSSMEQAAMVANLKLTQVRFWLGRFRNSRLNIFPEAMIEAIKRSIEAERKQRADLKKAEKKKKDKKDKKAKSETKKGGKKKKMSEKKKKDSNLKDKKKKSAKPKKEEKQKKKKAEKKKGKKKK